MATATQEQPAYAHMITDADPLFPVTCFRLTEDLMTPETPPRDIAYLYVVRRNYGHYKVVAELIQTQRKCPSWIDLHAPDARREARQLPRTPETSSAHMALVRRCLAHVHDFYEGACAPNRTRNICPPNDIRNDQPGRWLVLSEYDRKFMARIPRAEFFCSLNVAHLLGATQYVRCGTMHASAHASALGRISFWSPPGVHELTLEQIRALTPSQYVWLRTRYASQTLPADFSLVHAVEKGALPDCAWYTLDADGRRTLDMRPVCDWLLNKLRKSPDHDALVRRPSESSIEYCMRFVQVNNTMVEHEHVLEEHPDKLSAWQLKGKELERLVMDCEYCVRTDAQPLPDCVPIRYWQDVSHITQTDIVFVSRMEAWGMTNESE